MKGVPGHRRRGTLALATDAGLRVRAAADGVFALGDCAAVAGVGAPSSAQMTMQQAAVAAANARAFLAGMQQAGPQQSGKKIRVKTLKQIGAMSPAKALVPFFTRLPGLCKTVGGLLVRFYNRGIRIYYASHCTPLTFYGHLSPRPL